jgi:polysaccharide biosynthesis/export protein
MKIVKTLVIPMLLGGCFAQGTAQHQSSSPSATIAAVKNVSETQTRPYVIGSEDVLAVNVWKEPELSRIVPVRPDGKITLPLVGEVQASGLTPRTLQDSLAAGFKAYVSNPEVTVIVQEVKSLKFNIVGEISRPGSYPLTQPMTVLDGIAVGGGLRDFAKGGRIYVLRNNMRLPFDYKQVIKGKRLSDNVELKPGDTIVIP